MSYIKDFFKKDGFDFALSIDSEGTNFDKNLENNVKHLERLLKLNTDNDVYTILFITPYFADMLHKLNLVQVIKKYKVIFGLHIHPDNLPEEISMNCPFLKENEELLASYNYEEQKTLIKLCLDYLHSKEIAPIEIFRGGYFSMDDNTAKALIEVTDIKYESHNIYRSQYNITENLLTPIPVYAYDDAEELRLEYFNSEKLSELLVDAMENNKKTLAITHSYLLDPEDFHYKRDNISPDIYTRLNNLLKMIKIYKQTIEPIESSEF
ncbi:hypothetical protein [Clostridium sp. HMP27]|uniref:hypothetical protein n=1 Tax=Clostridium sp. HMP27 TaxID=1487921 RepID=UPI00052B7050|nr:hypothetical protein [Clostridium sp. HMP27]KGK87563.1 hypothetical protein DP68_09705 [Clostridium sp. HMP27]